MAESDQFDKKLAKELLIKVKLYRIMSNVLLGLGILIFFIFYHQYFKGDAMQAIQDPIMIIFISVPFLPAIIMSMKAKKAEKALSKLVSTDE